MPVKGDTTSTGDDPARPEDETARPGHELDRLILRSVGWLGVALGGGQVLGLLSMLALARLLEPKAFGLVALGAAILAVVQELQESGIGAALVYRRNDVEKAAGSVLLFAPLSGLVLFGAGFAAAPYAARALGNSDATNVVRVLLTLILIRSIGVAPLAILERTMSYRARATLDVLSAVVQAATAVALAFAGAGVWSLVAGQLAGQAVTVALAWVVVPWRPSPRQADLRVLRELLRYGRWTGSARIVTIVNRTVDNLVVARLLGATSLGFYSVAFRLADAPVSMLGSILGRVMFPVYSMLQEDLAAVRRVYVENLQRTAIVLLPVAVGLIVDARPVVLGLLGAKWLAAAAPLRILAVWAVVRTLVGPAGPVFDGRGKPHLGLLFAIPSTAVLVALLVALVPPFGLQGAAAAQAIAITAVGVPALLLSAHLVGCSPAELGRALARPVLCSAILAGSLLVLTELVEPLAPEPALAVLIAGGLAVYLISSAVFVRSIVEPMWRSIRGVPPPSPV
jgi:lipopolysaccharide exporter